VKKRFWFLAAVGILVVALAAPAAFGAITGGGQSGQNGQDNQAGQQNQAFVDQMFDWHQKWMDQAQRDGRISSDQAQAWQDHFSYMRDFHSKNGFGMMGSMMGGDGVYGMMGKYNGAGGYGGMMGNYNGPAQSN